MPKIKGARPTIEVVAEALQAHPNATVDELSAAVGVGRSSVAKVLVELEAAGTAVRAAGGRDGGRRLPDLWSPVTVEPVIVEAANTDADAASTTPDSIKTTTPAEPRERLGKGALGDLVRAHLVANADVDHGPVAVAKALGGKSSGAVGNALQRLCDAGEAVLTSTTPRRYRIAGDAVLTSTTPRRYRIAGDAEPTRTATPPEPAPRKKASASRRSKAPAA